MGKQRRSLSGSDVCGFLPAHAWAAEMKKPPVAAASKNQWIIQLAR
jgi:hypothetical protein